MAIPSSQAHALPRFLLPAFTRPATSTGSVPVRRGFITLHRHKSNIRERKSHQPLRITSKLGKAILRRDFEHLSPLPSKSLFTSSHGRSLLRRARAESLSTSIVPRRAFHATPKTPRDHHFDTLKFVQRLEGEGFSEEQSVAMMKVLSDVIEERSVLFQGYYSSPKVSS